MRAPEPGSKSGATIVSLRREGTPARAQPAVRLVDVTLSRGDTAVLSALSLALPRGGVTAIVGPNGAGKSVLLRVLAGLIAPDAGQVQYHPDVAGRTALLFQRPVLLRRSAAANLAHALWLAGVPRRERALRVQEALATAALTPHRDRPARALSGGEQQRLAMARALVAAPRLLLLDEPTASTDPQSTLLIEALILATAEAGATVVIVTHDHGQVRRISDNVVLMNHGNVVECAPTPAFLSGPTTRAGQDYLDGDLLL